MKTPERIFRKLVLVCLNDRPDGRACCMQRDAEGVYDALKLGFAEAAFDIRVSRTGCLGQCTTGVTVVIMPDNVWLGDVRVEDVPELVRLYAGEAPDFDTFIE